MAFETPTFDECAAFLVANFARLFPEDDVSVTSFNFLWCLTLAAAITDNHAHIDAAKNDLFPDTSEGADLERWRKIRGVPAKGATSARKAAALRVFGPAATAVPVDTELQHDSNGELYRITTGSVVGPGGYVDVDVAAIGTGSKTRLEKGQFLRLTNPPATPNLIEEAELQLDLDEDGEDKELDGALRLRVLSRFSSPPLGGAATDYEQWALEEDGIAAAYAYPIRGGLGTVDVAALHAGSGAVRVLSAPEVADLQAKIDAKRPISVKAFRVLAVTATPTNIEVLITPDGQAQNAFDWDDTVAPTTNAWDGALRKLTFAGGARPASMQVGDRLSIKRADGTGSGKERVVESFDGAAAVILEADAQGDEPAVADTIYSGGPLVELVREAIQDLVDSLGTANPDATRYGPWEGNLRPTALARDAMGIDGVIDASVTAPAALVEASDPVFPDDGTVGLITAGRILVRWKH